MKHKDTYYKDYNIKHSVRMSCGYIFLAPLKGEEDLRSFMISIICIFILVSWLIGRDLNYKYMKIKTMQTDSEPGDGGWGWDPKLKKRQPTTIIELYIINILILYM